MAAIAKQHHPEPAIRIDGSKRINLKERRERKALQRSTPPEPSEAGGIDEVWRRNERRLIAAEQRAREEEAMRGQSPEARAAIVLREVDNPFYQNGYSETADNPTKIAVSVNVRESAVESLYHRGKLDDRAYAAAKSLPALL